MRFITLFIVFIMSFKVYSQDTFSIIAIDPETGEVGAAGATCLYNQSGGIIDIISSIIPGKGGIMSQAYVCVPNLNLEGGINQMNNGLSPSEIIDWLIYNDQCSSLSSSHRQYGIIDIDDNGEIRTAGHTGAFADDYKEDRQGPNYSIQGNILLNQSVIDNIENNFNSLNGTLAEKLMYAMQGANFPGADSRCLEDGTSSSTAFLVVYQPDDVIGQPSIELNVGSQSPGVEPINILQDMFNQSLSLSEHVYDSLSLYPNPSDHIIKLNTNENFNIKIYDLSGKIVFEKVGNRFNIQALDNSVYLIKLKGIDNGKSFTFKFIKK